MVPKRVKHRSTIVVKFKSNSICPSWIIYVKSKSSHLCTVKLRHLLDTSIIIPVSLFLHQDKCTLKAMSNLNNRKSASPSYRKAKNWIAKLKAADMINDQLLQSHILHLIETTDDGPTHSLYEKLLPFLRRKHPDANYPNMPKCNHQHIKQHWSWYMKEFTIPVTTCVHQKGNGNIRDSIGRFARKESIKINKFASDITSPSLPTGFFNDLDKAFLENKRDSGIDLGQSDVIFYKHVPNNQFSPCTIEFFNLFKEYAANKLIAFNERCNPSRNHIHNYKDVSVQIIRYRNNKRTDIGGLSEHHDPHYVGTLIWVIEEQGCKATFEYKEKENGKWMSLSKEAGYTKGAELLMINNLFHRVLVEPYANSTAWSRIILTVFL